MIAKTNRPLKVFSGSAFSMWPRALAACLTLGVASCDEPKQDVFVSNTGPLDPTRVVDVRGGISPDPTGIIAGTVLYSGPHPQCVYERGKPSRVRGRVVLTLFEYDNPPPPEGRATTALNIMFVNPEGLFALTDCLPEGHVYDPAVPADPDRPETQLITRTLDYEWVQIKLGDTAKDYQIRGFYDTDEDMNPFFSVRNLPTEGDIAGAVINDVKDSSSGFKHIVMPKLKDAKNGYRLQGAIAALGNYVWLERPANKMNQYRFMDATRPVTVRQVPNSSAIDIEATLEETWANTCGGRLNCGLELEQATEEEFGPVFKAGGVGLDFDPSKFAYVSEPVDVVTVRPGAPDVTKPDGVPDPHPLLGANVGVPWYAPIFIMSRLAPTTAMQDIETKVGIPPVRMIGTVLLKNGATVDDLPTPEKRVRLGSIEVGMPPIAAVELDPANPLCRLPYLAPGNYTRAYEARLTYCSDLPTGIFSMNAIQGVLGGDRVAADASVSDTGYVYEGGRFAGQAWTVPNDLGSEDQVGDSALANQSASSAFVMYDNDLDGQKDCSRAQDPDNNLIVRPVNYRGVCEDGEDEHIELNPPNGATPGIDATGCLLPSCCEAIQHLCGVPLCEPCDEESCPGLELGDNHPMRQGPTKVVKTTKDGKSVPNCVPFPLPTLCCPAAE